MSTFNLSWGVVHHYFSCVKRPISATLKVSEQSYRLRDRVLQAQPLDASHVDLIRKIW